MTLSRLVKKSLHYVETKVAPLKPEKFYEIEPGKPMISISFDDFPMSAGTTAAEILEKNNIRGSFYVSLARLGVDSAVGKICDLSTVKNLLDNGHEIGSHTYFHKHPYDDTIENYEKSLIINNQKYHELFPGKNFETFAYPFGIHSNSIKMKVRKYFRCARTTTPGVNFGKIDLHALFAFPVYGSGENFSKMKSAIQSTVLNNGWLNLYTHDVTEDASEFGCTPKYFEDLVKLCTDSGARIVTLNEACNLLLVPFNAN